MTSVRGQYSGGPAVYPVMHASLSLTDPISDTVAAQGPRLRAFVRRQVADLGEVDDIVQDVFVELLAASRMMEPIVHVAAWLRQVARNRIIDRFRRRAREVPLLDAPGATPGVVAEWLEAPDAGPDVRCEQDLLAAALVDAIGELTPAQREAFIAHELDGRSFRDLAAETGIGVNTLLGRKHAAVRFLRQRLQQLRSELDIEE
jgi:RNA polymerase sigma factor (sigma-70 family)